MGKGAFEENGFPDLFDDPYNLKGFLKNYSKVREAFKGIGLEYLMDSAGAMRDWLAKHGDGEAELKELRLEVARLQEVERKLAQQDAALAKAQADLAALRDELAQYKALGDLESLREAK